MTVTGNENGAVRASYDEAAGAWVLEPIVGTVNEGSVSESFLPDDVIIVNRSRSDLILQGISFEGDVMGTNSVTIVSGRDTDLYVWGDITQRIDHPDVPGGYYSLFGNAIWWGFEGGRLYQGRKNDIDITINGDGQYVREGEGSERVEIAASSDAYTLKNILQNAANVVSIRIAWSTSSTTAAMSPSPTTRPRMLSLKARALTATHLSSTSARTLIR